MGFILKADCSSADAYAEKTVTLPSEWFSEFCVYLPQDTLDNICSAFSADFVEFFAALHYDGIFLKDTGSGSSGWQWLSDFSPDPPAGDFTADEWHTVRVHYDEPTLTWEVDGTELFSYTRTDLTGSTLIQLGGIASACDPAIYVDSFKVGTTLGGTEIFSDGFESGDLSAWDSTSGSISVVDDSVTGGGCAPATDAILTVNKTGGGSGTVTSSPSGIDCGSDCDEVYPIGTVITLTAVADPGSTFVGWSGGGCSGTGMCVVTLEANTTVTAQFVFPSNNTTCETAAAITGVSGSVTPDNTDANDWTAPDPLFSDPIWGFGYGGGGPLWWKYTNGRATPVLLRIFIDDAGGMEEAIFGIFRGTCGDLTTKEVADTACSERTALGYTRDVFLAGHGAFDGVDAVVAPGETVYVEVDGYSGDTSQPPTLPASPNRGEFIFRWEVLTVTFSDALEEDHDTAVGTGVGQCEMFYGGHSTIEAGSAVNGNTPVSVRSDDYVELGTDTFYSTIGDPETGTAGPNVYRWDGATAHDYLLPYIGNWGGSTGGEETFPRILLATDGETLWAVTIENGQVAPGGTGYPVVFAYDPGLDDFVRVGTMTALCKNADEQGGREGEFGWLDITAHPSMPGRLYVIWSERGADIKYEDGFFDLRPGNWIEHLWIGCFGSDAPFTEFDVGLSVTPLLENEDVTYDGVGTVFITEPWQTERMGSYMLANDQGVCQLFRSKRRNFVEDERSWHGSEPYVLCEQVEDDGSLTLKVKIDYHLPPGFAGRPTLGTGKDAGAGGISLEPICHGATGSRQGDSWVFVAEGSSFPSNHPDYTTLAAEGITGVLWLDTDDDAAAGMASTRDAGLQAGIWVVAGNSEDPEDYADRASASIATFEPDLCVLDAEIVAKGYPPADPLFNPTYQGWDWSEAMMVRYRANQPSQATAVTMPPLQDDYNYGAYWTRGVTIWPQCYGATIGPDDEDPIAVIDRVLANSYTSVPAAMIKAVLPYDVWTDDVVELRANGIYTFAVFTAEGMAQSSTGATGHQYGIATGAPSLINTFFGGDFATYASLAAATGAPIVRGDYSPGAGTAFADLYAAATAEGMDVMPILMIRATSSVATVESWASDLLARYPDVMKVELGNEVNGSGQYGGTPDANDYVTKAAAASAILRAGNPDIKLCSSGLSQGPGLAAMEAYLQDMIDAGIADHVDAIGCHAYGNTGWSNLTGIRATLVSNGLSDYEIWVTEWGAATNGGPFSGGVSEAAQAAEVTNRFAYFVATPWIGDTHFYSNVDHDTTGGTDDEDHYGLYHTDGSAKAAVDAFVTAMRSAGAPVADTGISALRTLIIGWFFDDPAGTSVYAYEVPALLDGPERWYNDNVQMDGSDVAVGVFTSFVDVDGTASNGGQGHRTLSRDRYGQTWGVYPGGNLFFFDTKCFTQWRVLPTPTPDGVFVRFHEGRQMTLSQPDDLIRTAARLHLISTETQLAIDRIKILRDWFICDIGSLVAEAANPIIAALRFRAQESGATPAGLTASADTHLSGIRYRALASGETPADLDASADTLLSGIRFRAE